MSTDPRRAPGGAERPEERTDPMLPVIRDGTLPPPETTGVPTLDDRTLAALIAELDGDDPATSCCRSSVPPPDSGSVPPRDPGAGSPPPPDPGAGSSPPPTQPDGPGRAGPGTEPVRGRSCLARPPPTRRYGYPGHLAHRPPSAVAEPAGLTGLSRRARGRVGSLVFTAMFVAIFVLILVQAVASLLAAGR